MRQTKEVDDALYSMSFRNPRRRLQKQDKDLLLPELRHDRHLPLPRKAAKTARRRLEIPRSGLFVSKKRVRFVGSLELLDLFWSQLDFHRSSQLV